MPGTEQNEFLELLRSPVYNRNALTIIDSLSLSFQKAFLGNSPALCYHSLFKCLYSLYKSWSIWWLQSHHGTPTPTISLKTTDFQTLLFFFFYLLPDGYLNHCLPPTMKSINTQVLRIHTVVSLHENNIKWVHFAEKQQHVSKISVLLHRLHKVYCVTDSPEAFLLYLGL